MQWHSDTPDGGLRYLLDFEMPTDLVSMPPRDVAQGGGILNRI